MFEQASREKNILQLERHPFLMRLEYVFTTNKTINFVMPFARGGDLHGHLTEARKFTEDLTRFYTI